MSRNPKQDYTQYVHKFTDEHGQTRYAVGKWDAEQAQYIAPLDHRTLQLTTCVTQLAKTPIGLGGFVSRKQALRRARYLFGPANEPLAGREA